MDIKAMLIVLPDGKLTLIATALQAQNPGKVVTQCLWPWFSLALKWFGRLHSTKQSFQHSNWVAKFQPLLEFQLRDEVSIPGGIGYKTAFGTDPVDFRLWVTVCFALQTGMLTFHGHRVWRLTRQHRRIADKLLKDNTGSMFLNVYDISTILSSCL